MVVIGAVAGRARCAAGRTSTAVAASTDTHDETCLGMVLRREEPAARNLVQLRHGHAPSCMHDRKTRPASTQNDEEPLFRGKSKLPLTPAIREHQRGRITSETRDIAVATAGFRPSPHL